MIENGQQFVDPRIREAMFNNQPDELGSIWGEILGNAVGAGVQAGTQLLTSLMSGASSSGGVARGLAAINAFGQQAIQALQQILQMVRGGQLSPADAISNATRIAGALSDPQYVYQAQRGADAAALTQFKSQAATIVREIQSLTPSASVPSTTTTGGGQTTTQTVINPSTGQPTVVTVPVSSSGVTLNPATLLLIGGGLALVLLLKK